MRCNRCPKAKHGYWTGNPNRTYTYCEKDVVSHDTVPCEHSNNCVSCKYSGHGAVPLEGKLVPEYFCMLERRKWCQQCKEATK